MLTFVLWILECAQHWMNNSVHVNLSVVSDSLWPHGLQHTRLPCPSPTSRAYSNSCLSLWWCHPTISSSVVPFSFHLQSLPASVLPMNTQDWSPLGWTGWIPLQSKGLSRVFSNTRVQKHQFFSDQISWFFKHVEFSHSLSPPFSEPLLCDCKFSCRNESCRQSSLTMCLGNEYFKKSQ